MKTDVTQSIDIPLHEDDVRVRWNRVEADYDATEIPDTAFQEFEIEIPLRGEEVEIRKRPVVREHVVVSKVIQERAIPVRERLLREELLVDGDGLDDGSRDASLAPNPSRRAV